MMKLRDYLTIGLVFLCGTASAVAALVVRLQNPELTETQVFIQYGLLWAILLGATVVSLVIHFALE